MDVPRLEWVAEDAHMDMKELLEAAVRLGASDLHLSTGLPPKVRIHGDVQSLEGWTDGPLAVDATSALIRSILDPRHYVVQVLIDGKVAYDVKKDKRRF